MTDTPDSLTPDPDQAVRARLLQYAEMLVTDLWEQLRQANEHLGQARAKGVIGALDGAEQRVTTLRVLMLFVRDQLSPTTQ